MGIVLIISMYAVWSSIFSLGKIALDHSTPLFLTASRMLLASFFLLGFLAIKNWRSLKVGKKQLIPLLALAIFSIYLTNILEFWGLQRLAPSKVCFIYSLSPFFAAIFSYIHFKEKMTRKKFVGICIGFSGFIPGLIANNDTKEFLLSFRFVSLAEVAVIGAVLFSIYGWVLLRIIVKNQTLSPIYANGYAMLIGGGLALFHSFLMDSWHPLPVTNQHFLPFAQMVILMTFVSNILCYNLYGYMLRKFTATFLSLVGLLSPIFSSIYDWILRDTPPSWVLYLSTAIVASGLFLVYQTELRQGYIVKRGERPAKAEG